MTDLELAIVKLLRTANGDPAHLSASQARAVINEYKRLRLAVDHAERYGKYLKVWELEKRIADMAAELDRLKAREAAHTAAFDNLGTGMVQIAAKMERELRARIAELEAEVRGG